MCGTWIRVFSRKIFGNLVERDIEAIAEH